ncbi:hypothetical protein EBB79_01265 [Parasedimentitalea marina]|uniref:Uncharacterized protein n=1 Tax=Parasedimentitalea marina TaxID=2483033 RepID=A0A3T0MY20_9RHOB|nr:hypothetical protein EBB79_01265 [Parasedimentitalea marina]
MIYILILLAMAFSMLDISQLLYPFSVTYLTISMGLDPLLAFVVAIGCYGFLAELILRYFNVRKR